MPETPTPRPFSARFVAERDARPSPARIPASSLPLGEWDTMDRFARSGLPGAERYAIELGELAVRHGAPELGGELLRIALQAASGMGRAGTSLRTRAQAALHTARRLGARAEISR